MTRVVDVGCWCPDVGWVDDLDPRGWTRTQRTWTLDGSCWRRRGDTDLGLVAFRRLTRNGRPRVFHASAGRVHEHLEEGRRQLLAAAERGLAGQVEVMREITVAELRDRQRELALLVVESC